MTTLAINNLWNYLDGLALTSSEATWLSEKLKTKAGKLRNEVEYKKPTKEQIIREKFKGLEISPAIRKFRGSVKLDTEDLTDEKTQYIIRK